MLQLTDTQLLILSAASQRDDRGVELPTNVRGEAARKIVQKLIRAGLLEEVRASGSLPIWQRHEQRGPMALRITKDGLAAIDVEDGAGVAEGDVLPYVVAPETGEPAHKAIGLRKRRALAAQKLAHEEHQPGKAKSKARSRRGGRPSSKQARVLAMLGRAEGATIAAIMRATDWQQHSVRGFLAGVVRKRLKLKLRSKKVDGQRIYQIAVANNGKSGARQSQHRPS
jgi:uncharacterized protein DUF3489